MPDRLPRYGMILLDAEPTLWRSRGEAVIFHSGRETVAYARLHSIRRWMAYGREAG
jgi:hypothetical protein